MFCRWKATNLMISPSVQNFLTVTVTCSISLCVATPLPKGLYRDSKWLSEVEVEPERGVWWFECLMNREGKFSLWMHPYSFTSRTYNRVSEGTENANSLFFFHHHATSPSLENHLWWRECDSFTPSFSHGKMRKESSEHVPSIHSLFLMLELSVKISHSRSASAVYDSRH